MACDNCGMTEYLVTGLTEECGGRLVVSAVIKVDTAVVDSDPCADGWYRWAETVHASDPEDAEAEAQRLYRESLDDE
ncbi:hypothetical protein B4N89_27715 [Embleya scabrispora]|uniref:Uncharacterized protein n=1 Tax=Embleya scabrispora TaxID=159449 RepID=A0A1T3P5H6_9ACTN|nr:hypothetical protein [Embleya scabrispora]OPC84211.1 hypothetical protein B4N89_27715 [Embleya scabrispora]